MIFMMKREVSAHLSKELRSQYKRRSMGVRKGDEIKIVRGKNFGRGGSVTDVDTKNKKILVSGITVKRTIGTEKQLPIEPSNVVITNLNLDDNARQRILLRKVKEVKVVKKEVPAPVPEKKAEEHSHAGHDHSSHAGHKHAEEKKPTDAPKQKAVKAKETKAHMVKE